MYMPGRRRTASRPSSTVMLWALYSLPFLSTFFGILLVSVYHNYPMLASVCEGNGDVSFYFPRKPLYYSICPKRKEECQPRHHRKRPSLILKRKRGKWRSLSPDLLAESCLSVIGGCRINYFFGKLRSDSSS